MTSAGDMLRRERLKRNLGLDQISRELKISGRLLEAIEADQYDRLPGGVFAKAFVRQYASVLGLDGDELAKQVQSAIEPFSPQFLEPNGHTPAPIDVPPVEEWTTHRTPRSFRLSGSLPAAILVVVVMLICSGVYAWMQRPRTTVTAQATKPAPVRIETAPPAGTPPQQSTVSPQTASAEQPKLADSLQPAGTPAATNPGSTSPAAPGTPPAATPATTPAQSATAAATPPGPVHVEIAAGEPVWVLVKVDGKVAFSGTMDANTTRTLDGEHEVTMRLGNAGGVTISLNGKPVGPVGPKGQVRTLQLTSGGFQIVSAKPVAPASGDPLDRL
jgi:cytoskeleton protein RodZ